MRPFLLLGTLVTLSASGLLAQQIKPEWKDVIATWQGTSICTVPDSACSDEQALYRVKPDKKDPDKLTTEEFKIVDKRPEFMGDLSCTYAAQDKVLTCYGAKHDVWQFQVADNTMDGTLTVGKAKTVYRKVSLTKM